MKTRLIIISVVTASLVGCGGGGSGGSSEKGASASPSANSQSAAVTSVSTAVVAPAVDLGTDSPMQVDFETRQIFLPDTGWLSEDEFWNIYYNDPAKLPGNVDFEALQQLGYRENPTGEPVPGDGSGGGA